MTEAIRQGDIPGVQLRWRQRLPILPEELWRWLSEPDRLERWACDRARVDLDSGGGLALESARPEAAPLRERGETLELAAPHRWSLAFEQLDSGWTGATRLTLSVAATPEGCELDILQEGFEHLSLSICLTVWEEYRHRWREATARLAAAVAADGRFAESPRS